MESRHILVGPHPILRVSNVNPCFVCVENGPTLVTQFSYLMHVLAAPLNDVCSFNKERITVPFFKSEADVPENAMHCR